MTKLGFHQKFVSLTMSCVSSTTFSMLINGHPCGHIVPSRGLRQGDLLSPYLFLLCMEGLISLLKGEGRANWLQGLKIYRGAHEINHLLFADDCALFCKVDTETKSRVKQLLDTYSLVSGQQVNSSKIAMVFSSNTPSHHREEIKRMWMDGTIQ